MPLSNIELREVRESDLPFFFEQQLEPEALRMAAFPSRDRDAFMAHWQKAMAGSTNILRTIVYRGDVAGNIVCWEQSGKSQVGYWLGKAFWGKGITTAALSQFLHHVTKRPLFAHVAKHNIASIRVLEKCGFIRAGAESYSGPDGQEGEEFIMKLAAGEESVQWRYLNPPELPDWSSFFTQIVSVEGRALRHVFISGQVGVDAQKQLAGDGGFEAQTKRAFENLGKALACAGASWDNVAKLTIYVVNYEEARAEVIERELQCRFAKGKLPACSLIGVQALAKEGFEIEVEAIALVESTV